MHVPLAFIHISTINFLSYYLQIFFFLRERERDYLQICSPYFLDFSLCFLLIIF